MSKNVSTFRKLLVASAAIVYGTVGAAELAHAQIDEVVVTATKRAKSLQDIPVSVTAISADTLANEAVTNLETLQYSVPGLSMTTAAGGGFQSSLRMRGVGTSGTNIGFEGAVGVFVDGVFRPRAGAALSNLIDVERVEVLRGPQGTLFGRNTTAGAISVVSKKPVMDETSSSLRLTVGDYGRTQFQGVYNTSLNDKMAGRFALDYDQRDGYLENQVAGQDDVNDRNRTNFRGQVLFEPNDEMEVRFIANYMNTDEVCCGAVVHNEGALNMSTTLGKTFPSTDHEDFETARNRDTSEKQTESGLQVDFEWNMPNGITFFNSASYSDFEMDGYSDADQTAVDLTWNPQNDVFVKQFANEFRFSGVMDELSSVQSVAWILGGYYSEEKLGQAYELQFASDSAAVDAVQVGIEDQMNALEPGSGEWRNFGLGFSDEDNHTARLTQDAEVTALFAHADIDINERWSASVGTRFTSEDKTGTGDFETVNAAATINPFASPGAKDFEADSNAEEWITNFTVTSKVNDDVSVYASYADGYKSGGLNLDVLGGQAGAEGGTKRAFFQAETTLDPTFDIETVDTYEIGVKSVLMDGRATLNATAFNSVFENYQLLQFTGTSFNIVAAPEVTTTGLEAEAQISVSDNLNIGVQYTLAEAEYSEAFATVEIAEGATMNNAPEHTAGINATYTRDIPNTNLKGMVFGGLTYESEYNASAGLEADRIQDDFTMVQGRLGVYSQDDKYGLELWCRNCTNEAVAQVIFTSPVTDANTYAFTSPPAEFGLTLSARY